jgi:hypothetical protein
MFLNLFFEQQQKKKIIFLLIIKIYLRHYQTLVFESQAKHHHFVPLFLHVAQFVLLLFEQLK